MKTSIHIIQKLCELVSKLIILSSQSAWITLYVSGNNNKTGWILHWLLFLLQWLIDVWSYNHTDAFVNVVVKELCIWKWILGFPVDPSFKVSCSYFMLLMEKRGEVMKSCFVSDSYQYFNSIWHVLQKQNHKLLRVVKEQKTWHSK